MGLDVDPTDWAALVEDQPLVDAGNVEEMHARQATNVFFNFEF